MLLKLNLNKINLVITIFLILELYHLFQLRDTLRTKSNYRLNTIIIKKDTSLEISQNTNITKFLKPYCNCPGIKEFILIEKKLDFSNTKESSYYVLASLIQLSNDKSYLGETKKKLLLNESLNELKREKVTCDLYNVLKRGKNQRVIAYSLYGTDRIYYEKLELVLEQIRIKYNNYTARVYYDNTVNETLRCYFECKYRDVVDFCDVNRFSTSVIDQLQFDENMNRTVFYNDLSYMHKMMWRFIPVGDSFIDVFLSRDTDSFIIDRELDSVNEWLSSKNIAHIMRDSPSHAEPILGGMWGIHTSVDRELSNTIFNLVVDKTISQRYNKNGHSPKGKDQNFLSEQVYPIIVNKATIHDSYWCKRFANTKPFPKERKVIDHIGSLNFDPPKNIKECPVECRPSNHQDWKYC